MSINFNQKRNITHIYRATSGGTVFSANYATFAAYDYFTDTAVVNDVIYFGVNSPEVWSFKNLYFNVGTALVGVGVTLVWEYRNSASAWVELPDVIDNTNGFKIAGENSVDFSVPNNWRAYSVNSVTDYWVRVRISALTTITEGGAQAVQVVQAGDFCIIIDGYTEAVPCTFTNIYNAGQAAGNWLNEYQDVVTKQGTYQFQIKCHLALGHYLSTGGLVGYLVSKNEMIDFLGGVKMGGTSGLAHIFIVGEVISEADGTTKSGSYLRFSKTYDQDQWYSFRRLRGVLNVYNSSIFGAGSTFYGIDKIVNTIVDSIILIFNATTLIKRVTASKSYGNVVDSPQGTIEDLYVQNGVYAIRKAGSETATVVARNVKVRNCTYLYSTDGGTNGAILQFIDCNTSTWLIYWAASAVPNAQQIQEIYSINLTILDKNNNPIENAIVVLKNNSGTQQFSMNTDIDGNIAEQLVTAKKNMWSSGSAPGVTTTTDYNPFTLIVKKQGYRDYKIIFTLNLKVNWKLMLELLTLSLIDDVKFD